MKRFFAGLAVWVCASGAAMAEPVIVVDAGHGGRDPGAVAHGLKEANLTLAFALRLAAALDDRGARAVLTREDDSFVDLSARVSFAIEQGADALISIHADALSEGRASGLSVYTLKAGAGGALDARRVARHGGEALISGMDLDEAGDDVSRALMDIARRSTAPVSERLSGSILGAVETANLPLHPQAARRDAFAILAAPDVPSVLIELGYLSTESDRARLTSAEGQAALARAIADGIVDWWSEVDR